MSQFSSKNMRVSIQLMPCLARRRSLSSAMVSLTPFPRGRDTTGLLPLPITNTFPNRVANVFPAASLIWTMSCDPGCLSLVSITPTRPKLRPPVTMATFPVSNFVCSVIFPVSILIFTVSWTLMRGSGYRMVWPSWVTQKGTPLGPIWTRLTLPSLNCEYGRRGEEREGQSYMDS